VTRCSLLCIFILCLGINYSASRNVHSTAVNKHESAARTVLSRCLAVGPSVRFEEYMRCSSVVHVLVLVSRFKTVQTTFDVSPLLSQVCMEVIFFFSRLLWQKTLKYKLQNYNFISCFHDHGTSSVRKFRSRVHLSRVRRGNV
jgi:hypothetical protein